MQQNRRQFLAALASPLIVSPALAQTAPPSPVGAPGAAPAGAPTPIRLEARPGKARLRGPEGPETSVLGYEGAVPGPILRAKAGEDVLLRLVNGLDTPTSLHVQGYRGPNAMDGVAGLTQEPVAPGGSFDYRLPAMRPGTYFYHPQAFPHAAEQAGRGLGGVLIVADDKGPAFDHDQVVALADWRLDARDEIAAPVIEPAETAGAGRLGDVFTLNGAPTPQRLDLPGGARVRLRLVSMAMAEIVAVTFEGATPYIIAIDSEPCGLFEPVRQTIPVGPGARFDVAFDMPAGEGARVRLMVRRWPYARLPAIEPRELMVLTSKGAAKAQPPLVGLPENPSLPAMIPLQNATRLDLTLDAAKPQGRPDPRRLWTMNGAPNNHFSGKPLFSVKAGAAVTLGFLNRSGWPQPMRVHGHVMRQLHLLDDGWEPYWRDNVVVPEGKTVRVAFVAGQPGRWWLGSSIGARAESGLAGWFEVT